VRFPLTAIAGSRLAHGEIHRSVFDGDDGYNLLATRPIASTPADRMGARVDCFPTRAAFPKWPEGRHPHCHFRGLLGLHTRYGPLDRSTAQGGLYHEASALPATQPVRSLASGLIENYPGETLPH